MKKWYQKRIPPTMQGKLVYDWMAIWKSSKWWIAVLLIPLLSMLLCSCEKEDLNQNAISPTPANFHVYKTTEAELEEDVNNDGDLLDHVEVRGDEKVVYTNINIEITFRQEGTMTVFEERENTNGAYFVHFTPTVGRTDNSPGVTLTSNGLEFQTGLVSTVRNHVGYRSTWFSFDVDIGETYPYLLIVKEPVIQ